MLYLYLGTDRDSARAALATHAGKVGGELVRITDAHSLEDLKAALQGGGMFFSSRAVALENVSLNEEMLAFLLTRLETLAGSSEQYYLYEEKPVADLKKRLQKHATSVETFDLPKKERDSSIFAIANALKRGDKKALWVNYVREILKGTAPEAVHGILFWAAKDAFMKSSGKDERARGLIVALAELPHAARRGGEDMEYALERFLIST